MLQGYIEEGPSLKKNFGYVQWMLTFNIQFYSDTDSEISEHVNPVSNPALNTGSCFSRHVGNKLLLHWTQGLVSPAMWETSYYYIEDSTLVCLGGGDYVSTSFFYPRYHFKKNQNQPTKSPTRNVVDLRSWNKIVGDFSQHCSFYMQLLGHEWVIILGVSPVVDPS